jgi:transketolase
MKEQDKINSEVFAKNLKFNILEMAYNAGSSSSHFGGALSIVDIVSVIFCNHFFDVLGKENQFILSKGHACLAYYAALHQIGKIKKEELKTFEKDNSNLLGHPVINKDLGIDFSNGSLGMGLSIGLGIALAYKKKKNEKKVFIILGDGECNEGSVWEAAMAGANLNLNNIYAIIDNNGYQQTGSTQEIMANDRLYEKWESFGWNVDVINGHDHENLNKFFKKETTNKPNLLIAKTKKGKGFSFSENNNDWHHAVLSKSFYEKAKSELE